MSVSRKSFGVGRFATIQRKEDMIQNQSIPGGGGVQSPEPSHGGEDWYSAANTPNTTGAVGNGGNENEMNMMNTSYALEEDYDNEPPLLEELGINFDKILKKTKAVLNPNNMNVPAELLDDGDMAGPLVFCLVLGAEMLLTGKINFGYIYGFSICSAIGAYGILDLLMSEPQQVDFWVTCSILGYCLIPVCCLAGIDIVLPLRNIFGLSLAGLTVAWSTYSATKLFDSKLRLTENKQFWLVTYPIGLIYAVFCLITLF